ncbi:MAG TPA: nitroreductase family protein [Candidatus Lokiarchaeia archaeon]|nr:nitroreductase family protein [Candidatus Lokiarchaeia archaeon]
MQTAPITSILDVIKARRSTRRFASTPVSDEDLNAVLEAARWAPSGENHQPWKFLVIKDVATMEKIVDILPYKKMQAFLKNAPVLIGILVDESKSPWAIIDGSLCAMNLALEAWARGLGTCISAWYPTAPKAIVDQVKELLNIPLEWTILTFTPLGYPDPDPKRAHILPARRKALEKLVVHEKFADSTDDSG